MAKVQKIKSFLWFDTEAEEAAAFYVAAFPNSRISHVQRVPHVLTGEEDKVVIVDFTLAGVDYAAMNAGMPQPFTDAISMAVSCDDQAEVDFLWDYLTSGGGKPVQCGWLQDKYGLRWQITPQRMFEMLASPDRAAAARAFAAMTKMIKLDIAELEKAFRGA